MTKINQKRGIMANKPIPAGHSTVTPYLTVHDANRAIAFYTQAFSAKENRRITDNDNRIGFAELQIGNSQLMLSDDYPEFGILAPAEGTVSSTAIHLYVEDADAWTEQAVAAGATVERPIANQDGLRIRNAIVRCPFGYRWFITSQI
jgi:PhnB protein